MKTQYIQMSTPYGNFIVEVDFIARNRAKYYSEDRGFSEGSPEWEDEMAYLMEDPEEALDWLTNNMDLDDIKPVWEKVSDTEEDNEWFFDSENFFTMEK